jgi:hypothetical protein
MYETYGRIGFWMSCVPTGVDSARCWVRDMRVGPCLERSKDHFQHTVVYGMNCSGMTFLVAASCDFSMLCRGFLWCLGLMAYALFR